MITNVKLNSIITECQASGYKVKFRDIAYLLLCRSFEDYKLAYKAIYGADSKDEDIEFYNNSKEITFLHTYLDVNYKEKNSKTKKHISGTDDDITFEENKAEIIRLIKQTQDALAAKEIDAKDALKIEADLRIKLNDKFQVQSDTKEQMVVVNKKYDSVCSYCSHEVARRPMTKEEAMLEYNLIEKQ
jgi:hypothetical protein